MAEPEALIQAIDIASANEAAPDRTDIESPAGSVDGPTAETLSWIGEAFALLDAQGRCTQANQQAADLTERPVTGLVGKTVAEIFGERVGVAMDTARRRVSESAEPAHIEIADNAGLHWYAVRVFPKNSGVAVFAREVTDQRLAEAHARTATERLEAVLETDRAMLAARSPCEDEAVARAAMATSERRMAQLLERVTDGFLALDAGWRYTYVNERAAAMLGRRSEDLLGKVYLDVFPGAIDTPFGRAYARVMRDQEPMAIEDYYAPWDRWFENRIFPTGDGIAIHFTEVTDRKRAEATLHRLTDRLAALHQLDLAILASRGPEAICDVALEHLGRLVPNDRSVIDVADPGAATDRTLATRGGDLAGWTEQASSNIAAFPARDDAMRRGVPLVIDLAASAGSPRADAYLSAGYRTKLVVPLVTGSSISIGFIGLSRRSETAFTTDEIAVAGEVASQVTIALRSETLRQERQAAKSERDRLAAGLEQSPEAVMLTDLEGHIEYVNPAFERLTGYAREEAVGQNPRMLRSGRHSAAFYAEMWRTLTEGRAWTGDLVDLRKDGTPYEAAVVISPIRDATGDVTGYVGVQHDVTVERQAEAREAGRARERSLVSAALSTLSPHDSPEQTASAICVQVVQLPEVRIATLLRFEPDGGAIPLALEVDDGRELERVRVQPERNLEMRTRAAQGPWVEEWHPRTGHPYLAAHLSLGIRAQAYAPVVSGSEQIGILVVGSAEPDAITRLTERLPALLEFASLAGALLAPVLSRLTAGAEARAGIELTIRTAAFHPVFQPIVDLVDRRVVGYEALTRFDDGTRPDLQFNEAARAGLGIELELATLGAAVAASARLGPSTWLDLNVSPALLLQPTRLRRALQPVLGQGSRRLVLEITEHQAIDDYRALRRNLKRLGPSVELAVDDAGAGYASFRHILELRPRYVKLDYGLVHRIDRDPARQALVLGMVQFAGQVACQLIAEGVETAAERRTLGTLGIRLGQGFLLGRPAPAP